MVLRVFLKICVLLSSTIAIIAILLCAFAFFVMPAALLFTPSWPLGVVFYVLEIIVGGALYAIIHEEF